MTLINNILLYGTVVGVSTLTGRKYPYQALKSTFMPYVALAAWALWMRAVTPSDPDTNHVQELTGLAGFLMLTGAVLVLAAYLASVTKRGWYKPIWDDFKITLPKRHISRIFSSEMTAVLYGIGIHAAAALGFVLLCLFRDLLNYSGVSVPGTSGLLAYGYLTGVPLFAGWMIGRKYPREALIGAFHAPLVVLILPTLIGLAAAISQGMSYQYLVILVTCIVAFSGWLLLTCGAAYLASVTKRGWYNPMWEDLKITLLKRWRIAK